MVWSTGPGTSRIPTRLGVALLLVVALASMAPAAHADLYGASSEYKKGDYAHAFADFLALAELGQPRAQFNVAVMYHSGQGVTQSDIHAYAWATLAAENGEADAKGLADGIRPRLAPGSERIAGWLTGPYTPAALRQRLMPTGFVSKSEVTAQQQKWARACHPVSIDNSVYPVDAREEGIEGDVFVAFTLMPNGTARMPRIILDVPPGTFAAATRKSILLDEFAPLPAGSHPIPCVSFYRYQVLAGQSFYDYPRLVAYVNKVKRSANGGDPSAQLMYGLVLVGLPQLRKASDAGLPWFVRAARAGLPLAQFEVGYSLLTGIGCQRDQAKALEWLHMAADQNEPNAEVTLAMGAMRGAPGFGDSTQAKSWLEKAAAQGNHDGELDLSALLAAASEPGLRDPQRALELLKTVLQGVEEVDPTTLEIRAAAQAADGDFAHAVASEQKAISQAHYLKWDLTPLQARLASYQAGKAWYGDLLDF